MIYGFGKETDPRRPRAHHYEFGNPGEQNEGIRRRIRQGLGGPTRIEAGAEVDGHYHIPSGEAVDTGDTIFVDDNSSTGGRWEVKIDNITGFPGARFNERMIRQESGITGVEFQGTCVGRAGRVR